MSAIGVWVKADVQQTSRKPDLTCCFSGATAAAVGLHPGELNLDKKSTRCVL